MLSSKLPPSMKSKPSSSGHPHSHLWPLNRLLKKVNQLIHDALRRIDRGNHKCVRLHRTPVKIVPKAANPLSKKDTLRSTVAFPEWVQHINCVVKVRNLLCQFAMRQALATELSQAFEARNRTRFDFRSGNKSRPFLGEADGAYLSSPVIEITEQKMMDAFVVVKVKTAGNRLLVQQAGFS